MEDKSYYKRLFPLLNDYHLINNSETDRYNCISHTLGIKNVSSWSHKDEQKFYWPVKRELSIEAFDEFYKYHGFIKQKYLDDRYDKNILKVGLYTKEIDNSDEIKKSSRKELISVFKGKKGRITDTKMNEMRWKLFNSPK